MLTAKNGEEMYGHLATRCPSYSESPIKGMAYYSNYFGHWVWAGKITGQEKFVVTGIKEKGHVFVRSLSNDMGC